jgi:hypothetical protein
MDDRHRGEGPTAESRETNPAFDRWPTFDIDHTVDPEGCTMYLSPEGEGPSQGAWIFAAEGSHIGVDDSR